MLKLEPSYRQATHTGKGADAASSWRTVDATFREQAPILMMSLGASACAMVPLPPCPKSKYVRAAGSSRTLPACSDRARWWDDAPPSPKRTSQAGAEPSVHVRPGKRRLVKVSVETSCVTATAVAGAQPARNAGRPRFALLCSWMSFEPLCAAKFRLLLTPPQIYQDVACHAMPGGSRLRPLSCPPARWTAVPCRRACCSPARLKGCPQALLGNTTLASIRIRAKGGCCMGHGGFRIVAVQCVRVCWLPGAAAQKPQRKSKPKT